MNFNPQSYRNDYYLGPTNGTRKKIQNYSYGLSDKIGKGYSSIVYKGKNDNTGIELIIDANNIQSLCLIDQNHRFRYLHNIQIYWTQQLHTSHILFLFICLHFLDQVVAIKVIDMKGVKDQVGKQMLECQIQALKTLNHPNILKCFDVFTTINNCYIITQFCNQGDLSSLISKKKKLTETQTLVFLKDIVLGFIQMASKNYLHRDLKLANIFLNNGVAKIADFGFAKKNTNPGQKQKYNVGSPLYMSPEALKRNIYTIKNDIWSLGVIIYELLHGETPWECKTQKQLMDKMVRIPVTFTVKISEDLKQFIKKCLEVDEKHRLGLHQIKNHSLVKRISVNQHSHISLPPLNNQPLQSLVLQQQSVLNRIDQNVPRKSQSNNKQNIIPRSTIQKNNTILVHHINIFRLLYKIVQQIKLNYPQQKQIINIVSNDVLAKVTYLKNLMFPNNTFNYSKTHDPLELKQFDKYSNQSVNPTIKKYKTVITQYFKKYTSEFKIFEDSHIKSYNSKNEIIETKFKDFLKNHEPIQSQNLLFHWIQQFCLNISRQPQIKKDLIQNIIQPKLKPNIQVLKQKAKQILLY